MLLSALLAALVVSGSVLALAPRPVSSQDAPLHALRAATDGRLRISYHRATGQVRFLGTDLDHPMPRSSGLDPGASPETAAREFLREYGSLFGLADPASQLTLMRSRLLDQGGAAVRFQQVHQGIPVFGGELIVNLDTDQNVLSASGEIMPGVAVGIQPAVLDGTARGNAIEAVARGRGLEAARLQASPPELWIYYPALVRPLGSSETAFARERLVWRTEVTALGLEPVRELVLVDAQRGNLALHFSQIESVKNRMTYDANNANSLPGTLACDEGDPGCTDGADLHADKAHLYAGDTYDFYQTYHSRDSIDDAGLTIKSSVHYSAGYPNAFWNGEQMVYGDGYGFPLADDVVAHELTHGVTQYESNLFYYYQSGAINESFSDVWGEFVDLTNYEGNDDPGVRWLAGEDISGLGAVRDMENPPAFLDPDKMTSTYYNSLSGDSWSSSFDSGGVHTNSGVNNKAAFLMTDGGTFNSQTVTALGITKVAKIYYEVQANLLTSGADFADLYDALYQACSNLIGTDGIINADCGEVRDATEAVEMDVQPVAGFNVEAEVCAPGETPVYLFFDDLEGGAGNWTFGVVNGVGTNRWRYDSPYGSFAHSGSHFLYADDYPDDTADTYAAMNSNVILPANAYLHFAHAHGFENPFLGSYYDGGVLEYSTNSGATWNDLGSLFDSNGYDGTLNSSNPMGSRPAFVSDSHGYVSSRASLSTLSGSNVRFRWRMGLDSVGFDWGWWLDDVRIYTCVDYPYDLFLPLTIR